MTLAKRASVVALALAGSALVYGDDRREEIQGDPAATAPLAAAPTGASASPSTSVSTSAPTSTRSSLSETLTSIQEQRREAVVQQDIFAALDLAPKPAPPPAAAPPPAPQAPPMPYTFVGRFGEGANAVIFLSRQEHGFTVKQGDVIEGAYRLENIDTLTLVHLATGQKQTANATPIGGSPSQGGPISSEPGPMPPNAAPIMSPQGAASPPQLPPDSRPANPPGAQPAARAGGQSGASTSTEASAAGSSNTSAGAPSAFGIVVPGGASGGAQQPVPNPVMELPAWR